MFLFVCRCFGGEMCWPFSCVSTLLEQDNQFFWIVWSRIRRVDAYVICLMIRRLDWNFQFNQFNQDLNLQNRSWIHLISPFPLPGVMCLPGRSTQHFCCLRCSVVQVELQKAGTRVEGATCQGTARAFNIMLVYGVSWSSSWLHGGVLLDPPPSTNQQSTTQSSGLSPTSATLSHHPLLQELHSLVFNYPNFRAAIFTSKSTFQIGLGFSDLL